MLFKLLDALFKTDPTKYCSKCKGKLDYKDHNDHFGGIFGASVTKVCSRCGNSITYHHSYY